MDDAWADNEAELGGETAALLHVCIYILGAWVPGFVASH